METRGRKPLQPETHPVLVNEDAVRTDLAAADALPALQAGLAEHQEVILAQYGDGLPYDRLRYVDKCRYHMARSAEEALEVGRCLIVMKECEGHGDWMNVLEDVGIAPRTAQAMMQATLRFANAPTSAHLIAAAKSKSKLLELMILDDEEMTALNDGESVRGIQLDDVERMSVSELRRALRKEKADKEAEVTRARAGVSGELAAKDRLIAEGKKRIAELVEEKNKRECMTEGELTAELERALSEATLLAVGALIPARKAVDRLRALDHCPQGLYVAAQGALHRIVTEVQSIALDYGIGLDFGLPAGEADPDFGDGLDDPNAGEVFGNESGLGQQG
jgi:hypothetical protein